VNLKLLLPTHVLIDQPVTRVVAEAENGLFCVLPKHIDFVASLVPGILTFATEEQPEQFVAIGEGIFVKSGSEVRVSTRNAVRGTDLGTLRQTVSEQFQVLDERERNVRSAMARLEADFVRRFLETGKPAGPVGERIRGR
jgi:F-type H+-transporting ATPase subunit epsilon